LGLGYDVEEGEDVVAQRYDVAIGGVKGGGRELGNDEAAPVCSEELVPGERTGGRRFHLTLDDVHNCGCFVLVIG
jgi:hypothetical protein